MRVLVTGKGGASGSWKIRGEQLGEAIGARVIPNASEQEVAAADVVIVVKRTVAGLSKAKATVYDIVDAWPQPHGNQWTRDQCMAWGKRQISMYTASIGATERMAQDIGCDWHLRHHFRPGIEQNQIRQHVRTVGYEGSPRYLDGWMPTILRECEKRGWAFLVNPHRLADCDLLLAVRGNQWRGYATDNWKSCVKLSNAIGSLTPLIALPERGYLDEGQFFCSVDGADDLAAAFDSMESHDCRSKVASEYLRVRDHYSLESVAESYRQWLHSRF